MKKHHHYVRHFLLTGLNFVNTGNIVFKSVSAGINGSRSALMFAVSGGELT